jgi:hypothetical protein
MNVVHTVAAIFCSIAQPSDCVGVVAEIPGWPGPSWCPYMADYEMRKVAASWGREPVRLVDGSVVCLEGKPPPAADVLKGYRPPR